LVVQFNHGFMRRGLLENNERTFRKLGVDVISFTPNWHIVKRLMLEALIRKGDFCWHCHAGISSFPMHVALQQQVPLIFWGEPSSEYTAYYDYRDDEIEEVNEEKFNRFANLGITAEDMAGMIADDFELDPRDLKPFSYPPLRDLKRLGYRSVCLGSYIPWDVKRQSQAIQSELGWQGDQVENVPPEYSYEKIECYVQGVRDWIKYIKRGYTRPTHLASIDIRNNRLSREEGEKLIEDFEGRRPPSLDLFLDYVGLDEEDFIDVATSHAVSPFEFDPAKTRPGEKLHDFDEWQRKESMPTEEAQEQLQRWRQRNQQP
jgi:hypothetical protein